MTTDEREGLPSASGMERIYMCAASKREEANAPDRESDDEAIEGQEIHEAKRADDFTGLDEGGRTIAENLTRLEQDALEQFKQTHSPTVIITREERFWIKDEGFKKLASAKLDFAAIGPKSALALDYKTGYLPVTKVQKNIQMRIQALALSSEYPHLDRIVVGVAAYRFKGSLDMVDYDRKLLAMSRKEMELKLWMADQDYASHNPGPWCGRCKANGHCAAAAAYSMLPAVQTATMVAERLGAEITEEYLVEAAGRLTPQQAAFMNRSAPVIKKILEAVKDRLKQMSDDELKAVGFQRGKVVRTRRLHDAQATWQSLWSLGQINGITLSSEEFQKCCSLSVGKIVEALADKIVTEKGISRKDARLQADRMIQETVTYEDSEPRLIPI